MNGKARYYNTGKVLIGCAYQAPMPQMSHDAEDIQAALLGSRPTGYGRRRTVPSLPIMVLLATLVISLVLAQVLQ